MKAVLWHDRGTMHALNALELCICLLLSERVHFFLSQRKQQLWEVKTANRLHVQNCQKCLSFSFFSYRFLTSSSAFRRRRQTCGSVTELWVFGAVLENAYSWCLLPNEPYLTLLGFGQGLSEGVLQVANRDCVYPGCCLLLLTLTILTQSD